ncbi:hypothetical protein LCGC14_1971280 [marine sediment metagenome]|uniref:Uncharacterized protein n=1 Tax=marine sediment metagenome TaxID=412755 RepID=A0A0F9I8R0_9ZZZZ
MDDAGFKLLIKEWEKSVGPITGGIAEDLGDLADECEQHRRTLPAGSEGAIASGNDWVIAGIQTARRANPGRFNTRYVQAIIDRWMVDGFQAPMQQSNAPTEKDYRQGEGKDFWNA